MSRQCIICQQKNTKVVFNEFNIDVLQCNNCGHVFSSYDAKQVYDNYFGKDVELEDHFWWNEAHNKMYDDFLKRFIVNKGGRILDVGCGLGYFVKKVSIFKDWQVYGYDISKPATEFATNKLGLTNIYCGKVEDSNFPEKYFDIITLWDVLEHILDPNPILKYLRSILKVNGLLFIHTPNIKIQLLKARIKMICFGMKKNKHYLEAKGHVNIYSPHTIIRLLNNNGFNKASFIHLHPIQQVSGSKSRILKIMKNYWFFVARILHLITFNKLNFVNLFVVVKV